MELTAGGIFLDFSIRKLELSLSRIRDCVSKLTAEQIWIRHGDHQNAVGNLILHLSGNVRQWIVSGVGGQPDTRVRDQEFDARGDLSAPELMARLEGTVNEAVGILKELDPGRLVEMYQPQKNRVPILEGIYASVEHFAQHTAQIIFITKLLSGEDMGFYKHLNKQRTSPK